MLRILEKSFDMVAVVDTPWPKLYTPLGRMLKLASFRQFEYSASPAYTALAARRTMVRLRAAKPDIVFAVSCSPMTHLLVKEFRTVHIADATVRSMMNYFGVFSRRSRRALENMDRIERRVITNAFLSTFPSRWACESAIADYSGIAGPCSSNRLGREYACCGWCTAHPSHRSRRHAEIPVCRRGLETQRRADRSRYRRGIASRLDVVGCTAAVTGAAPLAHATFHGFVNKGTVEGRELLERLYAQATFFILPTLAECYGVVFAEAAHHGLPSLSYSMGGVPTVIRAGETGILFPLGARANAFADAVSELVAAPQRYAEMSQAALRDARERLTWERWGTKLEAAVRELLGVV